MPTSAGEAAAVEVEGMPLRCATLPAGLLLLLLLLALTRSRTAVLRFCDCALLPCVLSRGLMRATLHLVNREFEALADDFVTLGMLPKSEVRAAGTREGGMGVFVLCRHDR